MKGYLAACNLHQYLKRGGYARISVPDANFKNEWYQNMCKPRGLVPVDHPAYTHKVF